jgi:exonuclease SbcC
VILKSLRLKNFKGLLAGVGLDDVTIDLSEIKGGLIAIVGSNGMGKTTILDNLHPYRIMPYKLRKAAGWSPAAFNYYDQCRGEARKELVFEMDGTLYKSLILIDADRRKQEAYLYRWEGDWIPLSDGKTKTYDEQVEALCGTPSLFFTSVFRSQGAKNLSDYTRGDIMGIVSELLNIDHIREQGEKAKAVADALLIDRDGFARKAADLQSGLEAESEIVLGLEDLRRRLAGIVADGDALDAAILLDEEALRKAEATVVAHEGSTKRLAEKSKEYAEAKRALDAVVAESSAAVAEWETARSKRVAESLVEKKRLADEIVDVEDDMDATKLRLAAEFAGLAVKVARFEKIKSGAAMIREKVAGEADLVKEIDRHVSALAEARISTAAKRMSREAAVGLQAKIDALSSTRSLLLGQAEGMAFLDCRADGSGWINETCSLLSGAIAARDKAEAVAEEIAALEKGPRLLGDLDGSTLASALEAEQQIEKELIRLRGLQAEAAPFIRLLPELEQAEEQLVFLSARKTELSAELETAMDRCRTKKDSLQQRIDQIVLAKEEADKEFGVKIAQVIETFTAKEKYLGDRALALQSEVSALGLSLLSDPAVEVTRYRSLLDGKKAERKGVNDFFVTLSSSVSVAESKLAEFGKLREQLSVLQKSLDGIDTNIADWRLLQKAGSNDGIIALEIDDAGPTISATANDLLRTCYGPRFSVRIETQAEKSGGGSKETFDIAVFDSETNEQRSITEMSGGQVCWIEDALTRAICLFNIGRSDRTFGTLYSDEKDGALDASRKHEFMAVKRRSMELGSHGMELFITQTPELIDLADGVIELLPGRVEVR